VQPACDQTLVFAEGPGLTVLPPGAPFPEAGAILLSLRTGMGDTAAVVRAVSAAGAVPQALAPADTRFDGPLAFVGYAVAGTQAWTYWRVDAIPGQPLSLMAHLVAANGTTVAVGDGMGFPLDQWQVGDIIVQRHAFASADGATALEIGGYWLDTLERWHTSDGGDSIRLPW
ncbi:MAG: hypothetical protein JXC32_18950, partial [Anaerolineae bacterium]|nr:hypothetical protein [Anaerolineae bacterium]